MNCTEGLHYNGDVAGIGVRLSFYIQNFILVLLIKRSHDDTENALWTFIATSFGLTVAALVQLKDGNLTLLDGILVSQLSWFANLGTSLALASYSRSKGEDRFVKFAAVLQGYLSMVLTVAMWANVKTFPSTDPGCDNSAIRFVFLFGWDMSALGSGKDVALVFACIAMLVYTILTLIELRALVKYGRSFVRERERDIELAVPETPHHPHRGSAGLPETAVRPRGGSVNTLPTPRLSAAPETSHHPHRGSAGIPETAVRPRGGSVNTLPTPRPSAAQSRKMRHRPGRGSYRDQWLGVYVGPIFLGILLFQIVVFVYFISTTELIITKSNAHPDSTTWGFGQVLAVTLLLPSIIALLRAIRKKYEEIKQRPNDNARLYVRGSPDRRSPSGHARTESAQTTSSYQRQSITIPSNGTAERSSSELAPLAAMYESFS